MPDRMLFAVCVVVFISISVREYIYCVAAFCQLQFDVVCWVVRVYVCVWVSDERKSKNVASLSRTLCYRNIHMLTHNESCVYASVRRWIELSCSLPQSSVLLDIYIYIYYIAASVYLRSVFSSHFFSFRYWACVCAVVLCFFFYFAHEHRISSSQQTALYDN